MGSINSRSLFDRLVRLGRGFFKSTPKCHVLFSAPRAQLQVAMLEERCLPYTAGQTYSQEFVSQLYVDLLNRTVDPTGLTFWSGAMDQGATGGEVALSIESSPEYKSDQVNSMYETLLGRPVDAGSVGYWMGFLSQHGVEQTEAAIAGSQEFFNDAGGTNAGFVSLLYQDLLHRAADPGGAAGFEQELAGGASRADVALQILTSAEYRTDLVEADYTQFLHRSADPAGLSFWVGQLDSGASDQEVAAGIIASSEYSIRVPNAPTVTIPAATTSVSTSTFTIEGTAENGSLVQIYSDGTVVGSEQLAGGSTSFSISVPLTANVNDFEATATNAFGNQSPETTVPPIDVSGIVNVTPPAEQKNHEGDTVSDVTVTATDTNSNTLTYSASNLPAGLTIDSTTGVISGTIDTGDATDSPYTVTVTAKDTTGVSDSATFTWLVDNSTDPTVTAPANQTNTDGDTVSGVTVTATEPNKNPLTYSATNLPTGLSINATTGVISGTIAADDNTGSPYTVTVSATDGLNTGSATFTWTITPVVVVTAPAAQSNTEGDTITPVTVTATDTKGNPLTFSAPNLPTGLTIDPTTGIISGTIAPGAATDSPYTVIVTATDGTYSGSATFTWTVAPVVVVTAPAAQSNTEGDTITPVTVTATDTKGNPLTFSAPNLPTGLTIDPTTGIISGTIAPGAATDSPYTVIVTATDGTYSGSATFTWTVAPVVVVTAPAAQSNTEGDTITPVTVTATDTKGNPLTFSAPNLPTGLTIDPTTGIISGTIAPGAATDSPYTVIVTATDGTYSGSATFTWTVAPVVVITSPADQANHEGDTITPVTVTATDTKGNPLTFSAPNLPTGLTIDPTTGIISGTIAIGDAGDSPYTVTVTATDGTYSGSATFTWLVDNSTNPTVTAPDNQTNVEGAVVSSVAVTATEPNSNPLTYSATDLPAGLTINATTGVISGTITAGDSSSSPYTVTVSATDGLNTGSATFTWTVTPAIDVSVPATQLNVVGTTVTPATVTATDAYDEPLTYSATNLPTGLTINSSTGVISGTVATGDATVSPSLVTVTATDGTYSSSDSFAWVVTTSAASPALPFSLTDPAWQTLPSGVRIWDVTTGTGATAATGDTITVSYTLYLANSGTPVQSESSFSASLVSGDLIAGWIDGIPGMQVGGERRLDIPSSLAYGTTAQTGIPANSELVFDITLISVS